MLSKRVVSINNNGQNRELNTHPSVAVMSLHSHGEIDVIMRKLDGFYKTAVSQKDTQLCQTIEVAMQCCQYYSVAQKDMVSKKKMYETAVCQLEPLHEQLHSLISSIESYPDNSRPKLSMDKTKPALFTRLSNWFKGQNGHSNQTTIYIEDVPPKINPITTEANSSEELTHLPEHRQFDKEKEADISLLSSLNNETATPALSIYCLGHFRVYENEHEITEWYSRKGKSIFKYLILNRHKPVSKEQLITTFWPDSNEEKGRNNLNVAIFGLRKALRNGHSDFSHIIFDDDHYQFHPDMNIWVDAEQFDDSVKKASKLSKQGSFDEAMQAFNMADTLYLGGLFEDGRFEEWMSACQLQVQENILIVLEWLMNYYFERQDYYNCINSARKLLRIESCHELAHQQLMQCYATQKQPHVAIRQYFQYVSALKQELDAEPSPEIEQLYDQIRRHEAL